MSTGSTSSDIINPFLVHQAALLLGHIWIFIPAFATFAICLFAAWLSIVAPLSSPFSRQMVGSLLGAVIAAQVSVVIIIIVFTPLAFRWIYNLSALVALLVLCSLGALLGSVVARRLSTTYATTALGRVAVVSFCLLLVVVLFGGLRGALHSLPLDLITQPQRGRLLKIGTKYYAPILYAQSRSISEELLDGQKHVPSDEEFLVTARLELVQFKPARFASSSQDEQAPRKGPETTPLPPAPLILDVQRDYLRPRLSGSFMTVAPVVDAAVKRTSPDSLAWYWYVQPNSSGPQAIALQIVEGNDAMLDVAMGTVRHQTDDVVLTEVLPVLIDDPSFSVDKLRQLVELIAAVVAVISGLAALVGRKNEHAEGTKAREELGETNHSPRVG